MTENGIKDAEIQVIDVQTQVTSESFALDEYNECTDDGDKENKLTRSSSPRRPWRYVVVLASFCVLMLEMASLLTVGVYLVPLKEEFDSGAGLAGWLASSSVAFMGFSSLASGIAVKKIGCRKTAIIGGIIMTIGLTASAFGSSMISLFVTLSLVTGIGAGLVHVSTTVIIGEYFTTSYTLANGIAHVGPGVGLVVYPPLIQQLIDTFGWRGAFFIEGAIAFNIVAAACLFRPIKVGEVRSYRHIPSTRPQTDSMKMEEVDRQLPCHDSLYRTRETHPACSEREVSSEANPDEDQEAVTDPPTIHTRTQYLRFITTCKQYLPTNLIVFVCIMMFLQSMAFLAVLAHGVATAIETGVSDKEASLVISVIGASSIFSRLTHGWCIDRGWISALGTEISVYVLSTVVTFINLFVGGFAYLMVFATCIGFASGVFFTLMPVLIRLVDTKDRFPYNLGLVFAIGAVGDLCGGYFAGLIRDISGSYKSTYYFSGGAFALAMIVTVILYFYQKRGRATFRRKSFAVLGATDLWARDAPLP